MIVRSLGDGLKTVSGAAAIEKEVPRRTIGADTIRTSDCRKNPSRKYKEQLASEGLFLQELQFLRFRLLDATTLFIQLSIVSR